MCVSSSSKNDCIAIFLGSDHPFNVQRTIVGIGKILSKQFDLHLITTSLDGLPKDVEGYYEIFGTKHDSSILGGFMALNNYLSRNDPFALTHIIRPPVSGTIAALCAWRHGVPFVYRHSGETFRDFTMFDGLDKARLFILKNCLGRVPLSLADRYIALGSAGKYQLMHQGVSPSDIHILPTPVEVSRFQNPPDEAIPDLADDIPVILFVGRKSRLKGIETIESVIPEVLDQRPDIRFVLIGGGKRISVDSEYRSNVHEVGKVPPDEIPGYFRRADLLVHPSLTEGFGRVLVEALAAETPVFARAIGEMPSITANTFVTDDELIDGLCNFESMYLNDAHRFDPANLATPYLGLFNQLQSEYR